VNDFVSFLKDFYNRKGLLIFSSFLLEKIIGLINVIFIVHMISEDDYGLITIIASIFGVFITLNGFGTIQGLLRFGALEKTEEAKNKLAQTIFFLGLKKQIILIALFCFIACFYEIKYKMIWVVILFFAIRMLGTYFYSFIQCYYRIQNRNDKFSSISIIINLIGLCILLFLTFLYGKYGYLIALTITPWLSLFFYNNKIFSSFKSNISTINMKEFWNYSFNSSITYFFSEILFMIDVFIIGLLLNEADVANYKVAIILPMNLMFLPMIFMQTDLPKIISKSTDKKYLNYYISNYYKLFIPLSLSILILGFFIKDFILKFIFGSNYANNGWIFFIILTAICFNMCFRNLYGNLLSAVGLAKKNSIISISSILLMLVLGLLLIPKYEILGAAISLAITFITMGFCSAIIFYNYLKKI